MSHYLLKIVTSFILLGCSYIVSAQLIENKDYQQLSTPVTVAEKGITVVEFFSYGCPYCAKLEPELEQWLAQRPDDVTFIRIAIPRKDRWLDYAKLYYALDAISPVETQRITPILYKAIHDEKMDLTKPEELIDWTVKQGIDRVLLERYFSSPEVASKIEFAIAQSEAYHLQYVPSIYVNGQYQLLLNSENNYSDMAQQLTELIQLTKSHK